MKNNNSTIILSGGGSEKQSLLLDNFFFDNIKKNGSILYIPTALVGHKMYDGAENWFKSVIELHDRNDISLDTLIDFNKYQNLDKYDALYIGGGNTWKLRKAFKENNFDEKILDFICKNKILYGGSAGAIILGENVSCQKDEEITDPEIKGINLIGGYSIACHYSEERDLDIKKWCEYNNKNIIAVPEDSGIIFINGNLSMIGGSDCFIFDSETKVII